MRLIATPTGRGLGRKPDSPDPRDKRYSVVHHTEVQRSPILPRTDLRSMFGPCYDQGNEGSCGANAGTAMMTFLRYKAKLGGMDFKYSRQLLYWFVRHEYENTGDDDVGVETRDILKAMQYFGVVPEDGWTYDDANFAKVPDDGTLKAAKMTTVAMYTRLVQNTSYLACLSAGYPFELGIEVFDSIDSDALTNTGVMPMPDPSREKIVGGHDVLVVGHETNFKNHPDFLKSGVDPALVSDQALLIRNSWGPDWGIGGHFWMPMPYATNPSIGGDAWTARLS